MDSRKDVDWQLKKTCEEFIHLAVSSLVSPIRHFLEKATYLVGEQKTDDRKTTAAATASSFASEVSTTTPSTPTKKPLRLQPFATPEKVRYCPLFPNVLKVSLCYFAVLHRSCNDESHQAFKRV